MSFLFHRAGTRASAVRTFTDKIMHWLWLSLGVSLFLMAFILPMWGIYSYEHVPVMVAVTIAAGLFFTGGIFKWSLLKFAGICWWIGALVMMFLPSDSYFIVFSILLVVGYLIPGFILRGYQRKSEAQVHA